MQLWFFFFLFEVFFKHELMLSACSKSDNKENQKQPFMGELPYYPLKIFIKSLMQRDPFISVSKNKMNIPYFTIVKISMTAVFANWSK